MASTHTKAGTAGAFGHDGQAETGYDVRGRQAGGKLHRAGARKWSPEETPPVMASRAVVVHKVKQETALETRIVAALERAEAMIVENRAVVAAAQFARLEAASNVTPFVSAADSVRARMIAQGLIS